MGQLGTVTIVTPVTSSRCICLCDVLTGNSDKLLTQPHVKLCVYFHAMFSF